MSANIGWAVFWSGLTVVAAVSIFSGSKDNQTWNAIWAVIFAALAATQIMKVLGHD